MLNENWDMTEVSFVSAAKRIAPEKFAPVLRANTHLEQFSPRYLTKDETFFHFMNYTVLLPNLLLCIFN